MERLDLECLPGTALAKMIGTSTAVVQSSKRKISTMGVLEDCKEQRISIRSYLLPLNSMLGRFHIVTIPNLSEMYIDGTQAFFEEKDWVDS